MDTKVKDSVDATKTKLGEAEALALVRSVDHLIVAKGSQVVRVDLRRDRPDDQTLLGLLLGPTGNLRAPTIRKGKTLLVGFNEAAYQDLLS